MLGACGMQLFIALLMVGLLKEYICTDPGIFKPFIVLYRGCSDIDIYTADGSIFMLDAVDRINTFKDILDGIVYRVLPDSMARRLCPIS